MHALAERIIGRNRGRLDKPYEPANRDGEVLRLGLAQAIDDALSVPDGETVLVLARNRTFLTAPARELMRRGVPFLVEGAGGPNPLGDVRLVDSVALMFRLAQGEIGCTARQLQELLRFISVGPLCPRGVKAAVKKAASDHRGFSQKELRDELRLGVLLDALGEGRQFDLLVKASKETRMYLERVWGDSVLPPDPIVRLTTIHGAKGREAKQVILLDSMSKRSYQAYTDRRPGAVDLENRLFYVGATRARERLLIVSKPGGKRYDFPSTGSDGRAAASLVNGGPA